jgi:cytochrome c oxidase subunit III
MSTANHGHADHAHHFESAQHEYDTAKQGVWLFLATEVLMFGGLFVGYAIFHHIFPEVFKIGAKFTDWKMGAMNTVVLLTSSLTMALGIYYVQVGNKSKAMMNLAITVICGAIFMGIKYLEYSHKIHMGLLPGSWYHGNITEILEELRHKGFAIENASELPKNLPLYFSFYYLMTGLHGIHVMIGMGLILWTMYRLNRGDFSPKHYTFVEGTGLFWHLIDLVWIYLFPLLYLVS